MTSEIQPPTSWWGDYNVGIGQNRQWRIGPLTLIARCLSAEWQIAHERTGEFDENRATWNVSDTDVPLDTLANIARYIFHETAGLLTLTPLLADRPVISRPHTPFNLPGGETVTLYVSTPLWVDLAVGSSHKKMTEIAIQRPSDTWFGPSTQEGELCYATTTHCRLNLKDLPQRPHRAITPVVIRNQADTTLSVERLNVPAPLLPLYAASNGRLWTPKVTLIREEDGDMAELKFDDTPPQEAQQAIQLNQPRKTTSEGMLIRAFSAVFS